MAETTNTNTDAETVGRPDYMLTTYDNPFDPFTEWDQWYSWDQTAGYHSPGLLDRVARTSDELSEADQHRAVQEAILEIVRENISGMHRKVQRGDVARLRVEASA